MGEEIGLGFFIFVKIFWTHGEQVAALQHLGKASAGSLLALPVLLPLPSVRKTWSKANRLAV